MKYKLQKLCIRLSSVFAVLAVILCVVVPASAYGLDPIKYTESYTPNGSYDEIDIKLPWKNAWYYEFRGGTQETAEPIDLINTQYGVIKHTFNASYPGTDGRNDVSVRIPLLGVSGEGDQYLDVSQVPDGSQFYFRFDNYFSIPENASFFVQCFFYDSFMEQIGSARTGQLIHHDDLGYWSAKTTSGKPEGAVGARFTLYLNFTIAGTSASFSYSLYQSSTFQVSFNIPSYIWDDSQEKTNATLGQIDKGQQEIIDQNKDMIDQNEQIINQNDQIINGTVPDSVEPSGSNKFDQLEDVEQDLMDDVSGGLDVFEDLYTQTEQGLLPYLTSLMAMTEVLELVADIPMIKALLSVSLALGLCSFILSVANAFVAKGGHK